MLQCQPIMMHTIHTKIYRETNMNYNLEIFKTWKAGYYIDQTKIESKNIIIWMSRTNNNAILVNLNNDWFNHSINDNI